MATTTYYLSPISLLVQLFSNLGVMLAGGFVQTLAAGTTSTNVTTYTDSTGTTQNANPIALSSTGRLVAAGSGAPVAVWVPTGTAHKMVITDSAGNFILSLDNLTALNDPTTILNLLSTVSTSTVSGGADLIANAVRSYDVIATVRAPAPPSLATGQTKIIVVEGATSPGDGGGGFFYWSASSTSTDDGVTVIKPSATSVGSAGRYIRVTQSGYSGNLSFTLSGVTGTVTTTGTYNIINNVVTLRIFPVSGTSNANTFGFSFQNPANSSNAGGLSPANSQYVNVPALEDAGAGVYSQVGSIAAGTLGVINVILFKNGSQTGWTATGSKGLGDGGSAQNSIVITYTTD